MANYYKEINHMMEKVLYKLIKYDKAGIRILEKNEKYSFIDLMVIREIGKKGEITVFDLLSQIEVDRGILATSINRFTSAGYVVKERSKLDKRKFLLYLTDEGKSLCSLLNDLENDELGFILKDMTINEQKAILKFLSRLNQLTVDKYDE